jgi:hypothetical protein
MTESNRQHRSAQPQRPGTGSVPVLFSLRNVQPNIVGGIANSTRSSVATTNSPAEKSTSTVESTPVATQVPAPIAVAAAQPVPKPAAANSNRSFNVVVGTLVIALCLLVIRNTQNSRNGTIASNSVSSPSGLSTESSSTATPPPLASMGTTSSPIVIATNDPFPPIPNTQPLTLPLAQQKPSNDKPLELGSFGTPVGNLSTNSVASIDLNDAASLNDTSKEPLSLQGALPENEVAGRGTFEQNIVQAKPSLLPPSSKPETSLALNPSLSFPDTRVAMNSQPANSMLPAGNSLSTSMTTGAGSAARPGEGTPKILDSGSPYVTTRELIEVRNRINQTTGTNSFEGQSFPKPSAEPSFPANPISYVPVSAGNAPPNNLAPYQPIPNPTTPSVYQPLASDNTLSGRSYPPTPQENPAVRVPPYEQSVSGVALQSQMIRQPAANNNSNRYPTTATPQVPYTSIASPQGGTSFGYPPGK